jgi:hypothetical protein
MRFGRSWLPVAGRLSASSVTKTDALAVFDESVTPNFKLSTRPAADGVRRLAQDVGEQVSVDRELRRVERDISAVADDLRADLD